MTIQDVKTGLGGGQPVPILPDSAPFEPSQRAWLNGFFAGLLSVEAQPGAMPVTGGLPASAQNAIAVDDTFAPWHDPAMGLDERMTLAEGKPMKRKLFAAMAQQDCGQCGYLCDTYAEALADGTETKQNLCAPGGKETSRMLKKLMEQTPSATVEASVAASPGSQGNRCLCT